MSSSSSSMYVEHFLIIVFSILKTFSAKNGRDQENTFKSSGSLYGGSVSEYYFN